MRLSNLTDARKTYLIGRQYEAQKMTQGTNNQYVQSKSENGQNDHFQSRDTTTAKKVATDLGVGEKTVRRVAKFSKGVDAAEKIESGAREAILSIW